MWVRLLAVSCVFFVLAAAGSTSAAERPLTPRSVLDGKVVILVPSDFDLMSEEMARLKYPSERRPPIVFTNYDASVNITVKPTEHRMTEADAGAVRTTFQRMFENLYPTGNVRSSIIELDGKTAFFFDMTTPAIDTPIRNLLAGTSVDSRLVMFSFNVTRELESEWIDTGKHILTSIEFRD